MDSYPGGRARDPREGHLGADRSSGSSAHGNKYNLFLPLLTGGRRDDIAELGAARAADAAAARDELSRRAHVTTAQPGIDFPASTDKATAMLADPPGHLRRRRCCRGSADVLSTSTTSRPRRSAIGTGQPSSPADQTNLMEQGGPMPQDAVTTLAAAALPRRRQGGGNELRTRTLDALHEGTAGLDGHPGDSSRSSALSRIRTPASSCVR